MTQIKILNEEDIKKIITMEMSIKAVENAYSQKNNDKATVWPLVFYEYEHNVFDLDIRSGNLIDSNAYGLKLISYNENNVNKNLPKVNATSLVFSSVTGEPVALLNAAPITSYRTGAAAAIGAKYLARENSKNLLIVGCGNIALYSIVATLITMPNIEKVYISNPNNPMALEKRVEEIKEEVSKLLIESGYTLKAEFEGITDVEYATRNSDIIITTTPSEKAMIKNEWVKEGTHFSCMGACMQGKQEIDDLIFSRAIVYADDEKQCIKSGEMQTAFKNNIISSINGEIGEVILNKKQGRELDTDITIFDSTGLFLQDLATSMELIEKAKKENIGIDVNI